VGCGSPSQPKTDGWKIDPAGSTFSDTVDEGDSRVFCSNWNILMKNLWKEMRATVNHSFLGKGSPLCMERNPIRNARENGVG
jgi:hypothetical protein